MIKTDTPLRVCTQHIYPSYHDYTQDNGWAKHLLKIADKPKAKEEPQRKAKPIPPKLEHNLKRHLYKMGRMYPKEQREKHMLSSTRTTLHKMWVPKQTITESCRCLCSFDNHTSHDCTIGIIIFIYQVFLMQIFFKLCVNTQNKHFLVVFRAGACIDH